jgi:hypothetical protein
MSSQENRNCKRCNGSGFTVREAFSYEGRSYPEERKPCFSCDGKGFFLPPNVDTIIDQNIGRKGLRSKRPDDFRAYYVWRMARFHGGKDVTIPMSASLEVRSDPFREELNLIADSVAAKVFGTSMAGAHRWGRALGYLNQDVPGLPDSAYNSGPVADEDKPEEEMLELR